VTLFQPICPSLNPPTRPSTNIFSWFFISYMTFCNDVYDDRYTYKCNNLALSYSMIFLYPNATNRFKAQCLFPIQHLLMMVCWTQALAWLMIPKQQFRNEYILVSKGSLQAEPQNIILLVQHVHRIGRPHAT